MAELKPSPSGRGVVFATLGPNPAPLSELTWKLARGHGFRTLELHVVVEGRGRRYLDLELLAPGAALDQLTAALAGAARIIGPRVHEARDPADELIEDDAEPEARLRYAEAVWTAASAAIEAAGDDPVLFGLTAGRRRTMTALESSVFQLLARPQDVLLDVRVDDPRVEGGTGFFFPEQPERWVPARLSGRPVDACAVDVVLVELELPRLRAFVPDPARASFEAARAASEATLARVAPPHLLVDLAAGEVRVDGEPLHLPPTVFAWYGYLCTRRAAGDDWVTVRDVEAFRRFLERVSTAGWWTKVPEGSRLARVAAGDDDEDDDLRVPRSKVTRAVRDFAAPRGPRAEPIVPERRHRHSKGVKTTFQRVPLDPAFIVVRDVGR